MMPNVLLLGDSIRLNYMPYVFRKLADRAVVHGPEDNCRFSKYMLWHLEDWMGNLDYAVIHLNCGIWDCTHRLAFQSETFCTPQEYRGNLERILDYLQTTGAKLILATSTPVADGLFQHRNEDILRFNEELLQVAAARDITVNDLHSLIAANREEFICEDGVHLSKAGIRAAGEQVSAAILRQLGF